MVEIAVSRQKRSKANDIPDSQVSLGLHAIEEVAFRTASPPVDAAAHDLAEDANSGRTPAVPRLLTRQESSDKEDEEFENIARSTKAAFDDGLLVASDKNVATAEYWVRAFCQIATRSASTGNGASDCAVCYPRFVATLVGRLTSARLPHRLPHSLQGLARNHPR